MNKSYHPAIRLTALHEYYTQEEGYCPDVEILAGPNTKRWLARHQCLLRSQPYGVALLQTRTVTDPETDPPTTEALIDWDEPFRITLYARVTHPRMWAATELTDRDVRKQIFLYTNSDTTSDDDGTQLNPTLVTASRLPMSHRIVDTQTQEIPGLTVQVQLFLKGKENDPPLWKDRWKVNGLTEREDGGTVYDHQFEGEVPALDLEPGLYTLRQTVLGADQDSTLFIDADLPNPMPLGVILLDHQPGGSPELDADAMPEFQLRFSNRKLSWVYRVQLPEDWNPGKILTIVDKKVENPNPQSPYPTAYFKTNPELANYAPGNIVELTSVDDENNPLLLPLLDVPNADLKLYSVGPAPGNIPVLPGNNEVGQPAGNDVQLGNSNPGNGAGLGSNGAEDELFQVPNPSLSQPDPVMYLSLK